MGAKKIKISKKEVQKALKAEELAKVPVLSKEWIEERSTKILTGLGILVLLVGAFWGFNAYRVSQDQQARLEYANALQTWPGEQTADPQAWQQVISALEKYLADHAGRAPAANAELDLARAYFQTGQYEKALKATRNVFDQRTRDPNLRFLAQYQLAFIYEALQQTDEALAQWQALSANEASGLSREALWNMARLYADKGDPAKAEEYGELALKAAGAYPDPAIIRTELASLKVKSRQATGGPAGSGQ